MRTISLIAAFFLAVLVADRLILGQVFTSEALALAVSFIVVQFTLIVLLLVMLLRRKVRGQVKEARARRLYPVIREKLAEYAIGDDHLSSLQHLFHGYPLEFEECLIDFLPCISGEGSKRLSQLALKFGLVQKWRKQARSADRILRQNAIVRLCQLATSTVQLALLEALNDSEPEIQIEACRALIRLSRPDEVNRVFKFATKQPLIVRAVLVEDLRPHALLLARGAMRDTLRSADSARIISTLSIIGAWRRALPLPEVADLLQHPDPAVCAAAFRVLHYVAVEVDTTPAILNGLASKDPWVKIAAARAGGRLKIEAAIPALVLCLRDSNKSVARAAAYTLCEMGASGMDILEKEILSKNKTSAAAALEALERGRIDRYEYAGLA